MGEFERIFFFNLFINIKEIKKKLLHSSAVFENFGRSVAAQQQDFERKDFQYFY